MAWETEMKIAREAVRRASRLCSEAQAATSEKGTLAKSDQSPVTVADFGAQALVFSLLFKSFPSIPMVGEEDAKELRLPENAELLDRIVELAQAEDPSISKATLLEAIDRGSHGGGASGKFWALDPIDGTKGFLRGEQYAIALALIEDGRPVLGVLGCPNLPIEPDNPDSERGCLLFATKGFGAFQAPLSDAEANKPIACDSVTDPAKAVFCESVESGHTAHGRSAAVASALGSKAEPFRIDSQCKYAAVARGQASIYLRLPTRPGYEERIWDHAAGVLILQEAGGKVADTEGRGLDFSIGRTLKNNRGVVATSTGVFEATLKAVVASAESD